MIGVIMQIKTLPTLEDMENVLKQIIRHNTQRRCKHLPDEILEMRFSEFKCFACLRCGDRSHTWGIGDQPDESYRDLTGRRYDRDSERISRSRIKNVFRFDGVLEGRDDKT